MREQIMEGGEGSGFNGYMRDIGERDIPSLSRGRACRFGPSMILACFAFPISVCSISFPADFGFILMLE